MVEKFVNTLPLRFRALPLEDMFSFENVKKVWWEGRGEGGEEKRRGVGRRRGGGAAALQPPPWRTRGQGKAFDHHERVDRACMTDMQPDFSSICHRVSLPSPAFGMRDQL